MLSGGKSKTVYVFPQGSEVVFIKFIASERAQLDALRGSLPSAQGDEQACRAKSFDSCYVVMYFVYFRR